MWIMWIIPIVSAIAEWSSIADYSTILQIKKNHYDDENNGSYTESNDHASIIFIFKFKARVIFVSFDSTFTYTLAVDANLIDFSQTSPYYTIVPAFLPVTTIIFLFKAFAALTSTIHTSFTMQTTVPILCFGSTVVTDSTIIWNDGTQQQTSDEGQ